MFGATIGSTMEDIAAAAENFMSLGLELVFYVALLFFTMYTLVLAYHWFSYGTSKSISMLSLAVYLLGGAPLFIIMAITF